MRNFPQPCAVKYVCSLILTSVQSLCAAGLLGMRSSVKENTGANSAELTFGTTLRLPGEFFDEPLKLPNTTPDYIIN